MSLRRVLAILAIVCAIAPAARAQDPPPRLPPFVVDLHGNFARFPVDNEELLASRGLNTGELPPRGFGADAAVHVYPFRYRAVTFGIGGQFSYTRGHIAPPDEIVNPFQRPVTERFVTGGAALSFNFGTGDGWSYLSGGIGGTVWQIMPDGSEPLPQDEERLKTINYGGGARWFMKQHLAFSFDVRFYAVNPGSPSAGFPGSPRKTLTVIGAGISLK